MTDKPKRSGKHRYTQKSSCVYTLKIELMPDIKPVIWRRLDVDGRVSLGKLHHFIQAAFGWSDAHLHEYKLRGRTFGIPIPEDKENGREFEDERKVFLNQLIAEEDVLTYIYDFGDNWEHAITVEHVIADGEYNLHGGAHITDGQRACPPEDVGGPFGYHEFLETLLVAPHTEEAQQMRDWVGGDFDPLAFDKRLANAAIYRMMYNGWGGK